MGTTIHPTAVVDLSAELADGVVVEPYAVIGPLVRLGRGTRVRSFAHIVCRTAVGEGCDIHSGAVVGGDPQDLKFKGEATDCVIGNRNTIRECVTINRGTGVGGGKTIIGDNNLIMAYVHIAHDCVVGNGCLFTNGVQLAGHVNVEDFAWLSGSALVHHFVTVGTMAFIAGNSGVRADVPPYLIVDGDPPKPRKVNTEGMRRRGVPAASIDAVKSAFRRIYRTKGTRADAVAELMSAPEGADPYVRTLLEHYRASERGFQGRALERFRTDRGATVALPRGMVPQNGVGDAPMQ